MIIANEDTEKDKGYCPYCKKGKFTSGLSNHVLTCPENPEVMIAQGEKELDIDGAEFVDWEKVTGSSKAFEKMALCDLQTIDDVLEIGLEGLQVSGLTEKQIEKVWDFCNGK